MTFKTSAGSHRITRKKARSAARAAKKAYAKRKPVRQKAWKRGGSEWSKVLGHFGTRLSY